MRANPRLHRYLRAAYDGTVEGTPEAEVAGVVRRRRWAVGPTAAVRVAAVVLVLVVAAVTVLVLSGTLVDAPPSSASSAPSPPALAPMPTVSVDADVAPSNEPTTEGPLVVHVAGAVHAPGVVEVPVGTRVGEALDAAGGASDDADLDALNLAAPVADGQQVYVPREGEAVPAPVAGGGAPTGPSGTLVDLNTADVSALDTLPGIGPALAQRIVDWRSAHGPFGSVDALLEVSGIGPATLERLRDLVTV